MNELHADIKNMRLQTVRRMETRGFRVKALEWSAGEETLKRRHMHRRWEKTTAPDISPERSVKQVSIWNELLCCVVAVGSASAAVTTAASASAAVVTALA